MGAGSAPPPAVTRASCRQAANHLREEAVSVSGTLGCIYAIKNGSPIGDPFLTGTVKKVPNICAQESIQSHPLPPPLGRCHQLLSVQQSSVGGDAYIAPQGKLHFLNQTTANTEHCTRAFCGHRPLRKRLKLMTLPQRGSQGGAARNYLLRDVFYRR